MGRLLPRKPALLALRTNQMNKLLKWSGLAALIYISLLASSCAIESIIRESIEGDEERAAAAWNHRHEVAKNMLRSGVVHGVDNFARAEATRITAEQREIDQRMARLNARTKELRVAEIRGALFQALALDYIRGKRVDLDVQVFAALTAARFRLPSDDEYTSAAITQGADEFAALVQANRAADKN